MSSNTPQNAPNKKGGKQARGVARKAVEIVPVESSSLVKCDITEAMVRDFLYENPKFLGLGDDVAGVETERVQPNRGGYLDLLLEDTSDPGNPKRYSVEIQRGELDESHIVRAIGYWDWERARFPDYEHHAVLVVEDLGRFFNVVYHLNRQPQTKLTVILMTAIPNGPEGKLGVHFRKILTSAMWGVPDAPAPEASRGYWVEKKRGESVAKAEEFLQIGFPMSGEETKWDFNYTKAYIGLKRNGHPTAAIIVWPQAGDNILVWVRHEETDEVRAGIAKIDPAVTYARAYFRFKIPHGKIAAKETKELLQFLWMRLFPDSIPNSGKAGDGGGGVA